MSTSQAHVTWGNTDFDSFLRSRLGWSPERLRSGLGLHTSYAKLDQDDLHVLSQDVFLFVLKILRFLVTDWNRIYCSWPSPSFKKLEMQLANQFYVVFDKRSVNGHAEQSLGPDNQRVMRAMGKHRVLWNTWIHEKCFVLSSEVLLMDDLQNYAVFSEYWSTLTD